MQIFLIKIWVKNKNCLQEIRQAKVPKLAIPQLHITQGENRPTTDTPENIKKLLPLILSSQDWL